MKYRNVAVAAVVLMLNLAIGTGRVWVGVGYLAARGGASAGGGAAIGVLGVIDSARWGWAAAAVAGGPAGIAAGAVVGL